MNGSLLGGMLFAATGGRDDFFKTRLERLEVLQGRPGLFDVRISTLSRRRSCHRLKLRCDGCGKKDWPILLFYHIKIAGRCRSSGWSLIRIYHQDASQETVSPNESDFHRNSLYRNHPYTFQLNMSSLLKPHISHNKCASEEESSPVISFSFIPPTRPVVHAVR
ncbi:hypothetical protein NEOLEDRAFT_749533 [Neolentinus lepideus HHB14362 ss-1]|uniref:Uncharacterized protein n=1 Tax=Neolentinus lepideus HHB14362 ss-1 TaxID=1314782 RepID=A0A165PTX4_9AGAM|nr:hypothetical protein NEOLEDRAFT_749533 [Neolentinus lepideus HHB14362 ss-1]